MTRVRTFSRQFPKGHPKEGQPTFFVEAIYKQLYIMKCIPKELENEFNCDKFLNGFAKKHTIRAGKHFKDGDKFSPRTWLDKPYMSKQIVIAPDLEIKRVYDFKIEIDDDYLCVLIDNYPFYEENATMVTQVEALKTLSKNDGLELQDFKDWFKWGTPFDGQIISWCGDEGY